MSDTPQIRVYVESHVMAEQDQSDSLIVAATNHSGLLDRALFRRFDDIITFELPDINRIKQLLQTKLAGTKKDGRIRWADAARKALGPSYADIVRAAEDTIKAALVDERDKVTNADMITAIRERVAPVAGEGANS